MNSDSIPETREIVFSQLDKITEINSGDRISAVKLLTGDEDYLEDHFPHFPVMPGVLMLEAMFQAASWLVYYTHDFSYSLVEMREAKNVKFQNFVEPGHQLEVSAQIIKSDNLTYTLKTECQVNGGVAVSGRLVVETYNQKDRQPTHSVVDEMVAFKKRNDFELLYSSSK